MSIIQITSREIHEVFEVKRIYGEGLIDLTKCQVLFPKK